MLAKHDQVRIERRLRDAPYRRVAGHLGPGHRGIAGRQGLVEQGAGAQALIGIDLGNQRDGGRLDRQRGGHLARLQGEQPDQCGCTVLASELARQSEPHRAAR